jgi:hypothetical protein
MRLKWLAEILKINNEFGDNHLRVRHADAHYRDCLLSQP